MSITAGRVFLAAMGVSIVICVTWFWLGLISIDASPRGVVAPAALGLVAVVGLFVGVLMFARFVDASVSHEWITLRYVVKPKRRISVSEIDEIVLLRAFTLPSRVSSSQSTRILLRRGGRTIVAFTPQSAEVVHNLISIGFSPIVDDDPMTPLEATRRYGKAAGVGELLAELAVWAAVIVPVIVIVWVLWDAATR